MDVEEIRALAQKWHKTGDREALDALVRTQIGWLHNYVRKRIGSHLRVHDDSLDFVQGALVDLVAQDATIEIRDDGSLRALLARIVDQNIRDRHRWLHREKRRPDLEAGDASDSRVVGDALHDEATPSLVANKREEHEKLHRALDTLGDEDREVIWLHEWEGLTHVEIAARLGISHDAARVRFQRALPKLAKALERLRTGDP